MNCKTLFYGCSYFLELTRNGSRFCALKLGFTLNHCGKKIGIKLTFCLKSSNLNKILTIHPLLINRN